MKAQQQGFTLVELMVAMVIGLILTLAALQLFLTNQRTFALQQALTELHDDGQLVTRFMAADIRQAGRGRTSTIDNPAPSPPSPVDQVNSSDGNNDTLSIEYWGTATCAGDVYSEKYGEEEEIRNTYSVSNGVLQCRSETTNTTVNLISGVDSFQVLYGLDTNENGILGVTRFVTATELAGVTDPVIVAIRFALLLRNDNINQDDASSTHWVLDESFNSNDSSLRRVYGATVQLRNYNWDDI